MLAFNQQLEKVRAQFAEYSLSATTIKILASSDFIFSSLVRYPQWLDKLQQQAPDENEWQHYSDWLEQEIQTVSDEITLMKTLRYFRRRILVRIAWSQALHSSHTAQTLHQLSYLAELLIIAARDWLYKQLCQDFGTPSNAQGIAQPLLILGMGKLGGGELNFSSDIDLIFTFPELGFTQGGRREIDNNTFFTRLGQRLIKVLEQPTEDGFVYRVDMRLRPLGHGGPLVLSFSAMEDYYQEHGRDWERYAMVKARVLGDPATHYAKVLSNMLRPFVFRRYMDFSILQALRNMKLMIKREVRRRGLINNIKLGAGGIREIEFIVQVFQLIRGGREPQLQTPSLIEALHWIKEFKLLPSEEVELLLHNYFFLRKVENLLQAINDDQTQTLPEEVLNQERLTVGLQLSNWQQVLQLLECYTQQNHAIFTALIGDTEQEEQNKSYDSHFDDLWDNLLTKEDIVAVLPDLSDGDQEWLMELLSQFHFDINKRTIGARGRDVLDLLIPRLFAEVFKQDDIKQILPRIVRLMLHIVSRTTYLELLLEYPIALKQLVKLCAASPMISEQLTHYPLLLDELIDFNLLYKTLTANEYHSELYQYLLRIPVEEEEQQLEALRQFKQMRLLHIAASDVAGHLSTMKVSDHLTYLAEAMVEFVVELAWKQMVARHGKPDYLADSDDLGFLVIAYGKLGGWELGYGSDLDLVFLHDCPIDSVTIGERSINSRQFYLRLAQRIVHLFSVRTSSGVLYEVDLRLRPDGESGLLACSLEAFRDYQLNSAWTWEHQALVRARPILGSTELQQQFNAIRHQVLCLARDTSQLKKDVKSMREKIREHVSNHTEHHFDIKSDQSGIGDIEFISQYLVLNYAHQQPKLTEWSDNVRILELMATHHIMPVEEAEQLTSIYIQMREVIHARSLQLQSSQVSEDQFSKQRKYVKTSWEKWLG